MVIAKRSIFDNIKFVSRLSYLIGGLAIIIMLFSVTSHVVTNWFMITKITIVGDLTHTDESRLREIALHKLYGNLITLDVDGLQNRFRELPWIDRVTVSRNFPHTLLIGLSEYTPIARVNDDQLVNQYGELFNATLESALLPNLYIDPDNLKTALGEYTQISALFAPRGLSVAKLIMKDANITTIVFTNKLTIVVCGNDSTHVMGSLHTLDHYWDGLGRINPHLHYINMCYQNAIAINALGAVPYH